MVQFYPMAIIGSYSLTGSNGLIERIGPMIPIVSKRDWTISPIGTQRSYWSNRPVTDSEPTNIKSVLSATPREWPKVQVSQI